VYDAFGRLLATHHSAEGWTTFVYGKSQRLARVKDNGKIQYFHNDYLGTARLITEGPQVQATPLDVTLAGPAQLQLGQWGTFAASIINGSGNYWCEWYKRLVDTRWISLGGGASLQKQVRMLDDDMTVKVEVWDSTTFSSGSATHIVEFTGGGGGGPKDPESLQSGKYNDLSIKAETELSGRGENSVIRLSSAPSGGTESITVVWYQDYLPFGGSFHGPQQANPFAYNGKELDGVSGLYDYGARWYDPQLGRFIQADSFLGNPGQPQSLNRYVYTYNNPLRYVDPNGQWPEVPFDIGMLIQAVQETFETMNSALRGYIQQNFGQALHIQENPEDVATYHMVAAVGLMAAAAYNMTEAGLTVEDPTGTASAKVSTKGVEGEIDAGIGSASVGVGVDGKVSASAKVKGEAGPVNAEVDDKGNTAVGLKIRGTGVKINPKTGKAEVSVKPGIFGVFVGVDPNNPQARENAERARQHMEELDRFFRPNFQYYHQNYR
jgi:RHS repeat-associated protein